MGERWARHLMIEYQTPTLPIRSSSVGWATAIFSDRFLASRDLTGRLFTICSQIDAHTSLDGNSTPLCKRQCSHVFHSSLSKPEGGMLNTVGKSLTEVESTNHRLPTQLAGQLQWPSSRFCPAMSHFYRILFGVMEIRGPSVLVDSRICGAVRQTHDVA